MKTVIMFGWWAVLAILSLLMNFVSYFVSPFAVALATLLRMDKLPKWLSWFDTPDNPLDGDGGWRDGHFLSLNETGYGWRRWLKRTLWLWRNAAYGFSESVCGALVMEELSQVSVYGDPTIQNRPHGKSGWFLCWVDHYWSFMLVYRWGQSDKCLRIYLGWKLKTEAERGEVLDSVTRMLVLSINPFMGFVQE